MKRMAIILLALAFILLGISLARNTENSSAFMDGQIGLLESYILERDASNPKVSKVDVAWHVDHSLKTINRICEILEKSNPEEFKSNFNFTRIMIFAWGDFPRGVAKSPKIVRPPEDIQTEDLYAQLEEAKENLKKIESLHENVHFEHPYFNVINKGQTKRFLKIHTGHHLKIIEDILK
ncbi:DUF1569 domain-containing protein [Flagellimonas meridianipacifica]|uniref:DUF1569 domain-containing protein n=1 Tax=Flagellimonas meridianipacifica TaxID=1080225 RepID=A0A2T0MG86_9FLAO|nr:DUF1569 domain-containing protein [Allomuricauda pacifica]PRX56598.1 hypothetical protein CLV81_0595 [Allomuricauda pacifica]